MTPGRGPRRAHIKSRSGCRNCKKRKVKCGEERPTCRHCLRRGETCDLLDESGGPAAPTNHASAGSTQTAGSGRPSLPLSRVLSPDHGGDHGGDRGGSGTRSLTLLDLELLHHYNTSTCHTLSSEPLVRNYFHVNMPQVGFSHPYVLYSILALAASHLAHFRPEARQYYFAEARARHTAATSMATPLLPNISEANSIPMYCFSILTMFISFASLREEDDVVFDTDDVMPNWLALFRGVRTVLESNNRSIYSSSISFLFKTAAHVNKEWNSRHLELDALNEFQDYLNESTLQDEQTRPHLLSAFDDLRRAFYFTYGEELGTEAKIRSIFTWMYKVSNEYLDLLRHGNSSALCILAYFSVLLHRLEFNWWLKGWGIHLIDRIYAALAEVHRYWIRWPIQEIGWIPPSQV